MQDRTLSLVCSSLESLVFSPSTKTFNLITRLSNNKEFAERIFDCRRSLKLKEIFYSDFRKRREIFEKYLQSLSPEIYDGYTKSVYKILVDFDLPRNLFPTINILIGTGLIYESPLPLIIWKGKEQANIWGGIKGFNLLILENMSIADLIKHIKQNSAEINHEMKNLPKVKKSLQHKDRLKIGWLIAYMKDSLGKSYGEIAGYLMTIDEDQYDILGTKKPIELTEGQVATYYLRHKKSKKY